MNIYKIRTQCPLIKKFISPLMSHKVAKKSSYNKRVHVDFSFS